MKNKLTSGLFALFLGGIGVHKFYLGQTTAGVLYLLFSWTGVPAILALIDAIILLTMSDEDFNEKYNQQAQTANQQPKYQQQDQPKYEPVQPAAAPQAESKDVQSVAEILINYKKLLDDNVITQEEFDMVKHKILSAKG